MRIKFSIPGQLIGKGRPKFTTAGGFPRAYTPAKTASAEAMVRSFGAEAMGAQPLFEGPLSLTVTIYKQHPASWSKRRKLSSFFVSGKPDCSNICKMLEDGLNGITWHDDSQIAIIHFARYYSAGPEHADIEITDELTVPADMPVPAISPEPPPLFRHLGRRRVAA